jgi:hypothetical protein
MLPAVAKQLHRQVIDRARRHMERQTELDWLRGLMLVLMTITHLPTWFSAHVGQPFGFVSAAEGFVFLSAYLVGSVYTLAARKRGFAAMRRALWGRAFKVYAAHVALLMFLFWLLVPIAVARGAHAITDLASFYLQHPHAALASGLLLAYNPPLLDILPMYVLFLLVSPLVLEHTSRRGWAPLLIVSGALWLFAQHGGGKHVYESMAAAIGWPVPYSQTGAFSLLAWQLLWLVGLRAGMLKVDADTAPRTDASWSRPVVWTAAVLAAAFFTWRHITGQAPFGADAALNALFDKWHLGPLRLLNFAVLAIIVVQARRVFIALAEHSTIATLGRASLTVFTAHLLVCLAALATIGDAIGPHVSLLDAALVVGTLVTLYAIARTSLGGGKAIRDRQKALAAQAALARRKPVVAPVSGRAGR